eukprot:10808260-Ditylum_brightwellii.AAC.1
MAASDTSGVDLEFMSKGGTGDHVGGGVDIWTMTKADASDVGSNNVPTVNVKSVAIDDIIQNKVGPTIDYAESNNRSADGKIDKLFLLKVDTQ